ncbi:MAG: Gfo/Idh/MocA family oxidoreductase, partial [Maritimibacter sp.]|nr:Gfo/Idh/MocA family oxidoreductase [Maritimibacter sp.]
MAEILKVGVVGAGMIGQDHIRRISEVLSGARVTAVTDTDRSRAEKVATERGARVFDDAASLIASDEVDAVLVCSWGPVHIEAVLPGLAAGKPLFVEKPLAFSQEDCLKIIDAEV